MTCRQAYQCCGKPCSSTTGSPSPASATCRRTPWTSTKRCVTPGTRGNGRAPEPGGAFVIVTGSLPVDFSLQRNLSRIEEEPRTRAIPVIRVTHADCMSARRVGAPQSPGTADGSDASSLMTEFDAGTGPMDRENLWPERSTFRSRQARPAWRRWSQRVRADHWSILLGEIALCTFVVLVITGVFLAFFFEPDMTRL